MEKMTSLLRLRMSAKDAHYGGNLVDGAHRVHLFGDVATELLIKCDGDEGLFCDRVPRPRHLRHAEGLPAQGNQEVRSGQDGKADHYRRHLRR